MIKFFRKVRQKLLTENRLGQPASSAARYLLYAIGEILLVVIGILIALQINNANETAKLRKTELHLLQSLRLDLDKNIELLERLIDYDSNISNSNKIIIDVLKDENAVYHDSLAFHFGFALRTGEFNSQRLAYDAIKLAGLNVITNVELRNTLVRLYDDDFANAESADAFYLDYFLQANAVYNKHFQTGATVFYKIPNDFNS
jgi:hypothetical protein